MDFLKEYGSSESSSTDNEDDISRDSAEGLSSNLNDRAVRQVYLTTYSKADPQKFPTRESFAQAVVKSFEAINTKIELWVRSKEAHQVNGIHYHMALKLNRCKRWLSSKRYLAENHGISVHFSNIHHNYYSAWKYTTKKDGRNKLYNGMIFFLCLKDK